MAIMKRADYGSIVSIRSLRLTRVCEDWIVQHNNASLAVRNLILKHINGEKSKLVNQELRHLNGEPAGVIDLHSPFKFCCSACGKPGFPLLCMGAYCMCKNCYSLVFAFFKYSEPQIPAIVSNGRQKL